MKPIYHIALILGFFSVMACKPSGPVSQVPDEPEVTLYSLALHVVDAETGEAVPKITEANFAHSDDAASHTNLATKASRRIVASQEGIVLASWIGPIGGAKGLTIQAEGYEPITVAPENTSHVGSNKIGPKLEKYLRTVKMKKVQTGDEEAEEADEAEAEDAE